MNKNAILNSVLKFNEHKRYEFQLAGSFSKY